MSMFYESEPLHKQVFLGELSTGRRLPQPDRFDLQTIHGGWDFIQHILQFSFV